MDLIKKHFTGKLLKFLFIFFVFIGYALINVASAQEQKPLLLSEAITVGVNNYQSIQAKRNYLNASTALVQDAKNQYLPNVIASPHNSASVVGWRDVALRRAVENARCALEGGEPRHLVSPSDRMM